MIYSSPCYKDQPNYPHLSLISGRQIPRVPEVDDRRAMAQIGSYKFVRDIRGDGETGQVGKQIKSRIAAITSLIYYINILPPSPTRRNICP